MKYIDAERLRKEVKGFEKTAHKSALGCADSETRKFYEGKGFAYQFVGALIDSLQQEQQEVDLEKDVESWFFNEISSKINVEHIMYYYFQECARRYFELGKNSK